jgi:hypothetical protein
MWFYPTERSHATTLYGKPNAAIPVQTVLCHNPKGGEGLDGRIRLPIDIGRPFGSEKGCTSQIVS